MRVLTVCVLGLLAGAAVLAPGPELSLPAEPPAKPKLSPLPEESRRPWWPWRKPWRVGQSAEPEPQVDLLAVPSAFRPRNTGGRPTPDDPRGAGLCVFTSIQYAAHWQNEPRLKDFQAKMKAEVGGGWPEKVDKMIAKYGPGTRYVQYEGADPSVIELALKTGRLPCVTWMAGHMLNCVHLDATRAAVVDNNEPERVQWMSREQFVEKWSRPAGAWRKRAGWVVVLLAPPPPPAPRNRPAARRPPMPLCEDGEVGAATSPADNGLRWTPPDSPEWHLDGRRVSRGTVTAELTDDSDRLHLTLIGTREDRARALSGIDPSRYLVQEYEPGAWEVSSAGFATAGRPSVYLQARDGRVLLRAESDEGLAGALRRADPNYDPKRDPGPKNQPGLPSADQAAEWLKANRTLVGAALAALAAWWLFGRREQQPAPQQPVVVMQQPAPAPAAQQPSARELADEIFRRMQQSPQQK